MSHPLIKQVAVVTPTETMLGQVAGQQQLAQYNSRGKSPETEHHGF